MCQDPRPSKKIVACEDGNNYSPRMFKNSAKEEPSGNEEVSRQEEHIRRTLQKIHQDTNAIREERFRGLFVPKNQD